LSTGGGSRHCDGAAPLRAPKPAAHPLLLRLGIRWPFDPVGPLALLATLLSTIAVSKYAFLFLHGGSGTPSVYLLEDPVSDLVRVSEAERQIAEAGEELPVWLQEWCVGPADWAWEDAVERWEELVQEMDDDEFARLGQLIVLAGWGDTEAMKHLRYVPPDQLDLLPEDLRRHVEVLVIDPTPAVPTLAGFAALAFGIGHLALWYVLTFGSIVAVGWWLYRGCPSVRLNNAPRVGTLGLLRGCEIWLWCMLLVISTPVFMWLFAGPGGPGDRLTDATWQLQTVVFGVPSLLLVRFYLFQPQGCTLRGLHVVARKRVGPMILVTLVVVGLDWLFGWGLRSVTPSTGAVSTWADFVLSGDLSGPRWLWLLDSMNGIIAAPIVEETLFRGVLYAALRTRFSVVQAAVVSAVIFSGAHGYGLISFFQITFSGVLYAFTYEYTRSLAPCVLAHSIHNLSVTAYAVPFLIV